MSMVDFAQSFIPPSGLDTGWLMSWRIAEKWIMMAEVQWMWCAYVSVEACIWSDWIVANCGGHRSYDVVHTSNRYMHIPGFT